MIRRIEDITMSCTRTGKDFAKVMFEKDIDIYFVWDIEFLKDLRLGDLVNVVYMEKNGFKTIKIIKKVNENDGNN